MLVEQCLRLSHGYLIIRVIHSSHFWAIFGLFFVVWQKNDQNGPKNEVKNDMKNGYCEHSEMQTS